MSRPRCASCDGVILKGERFGVVESSIFHRACLFWTVDASGKQVLAPRAPTRMQQLRDKIVELETERSRMASVLAEEKYRGELARADARRLSERLAEVRRQADDLGVQVRALNAIATRAAATATASPPPPVVAEPVAAAVADPAPDPEDDIAKRFSLMELD